VRLGKSVDELRELQLEKGRTAEGRKKALHGNLKTIERGEKAGGKRVRHRLQTLTSQPERKQTEGGGEYQRARSSAWAIYNRAGRGEKKGEKKTLPMRKH